MPVRTNLFSRRPQTQRPTRRRTSTGFTLLELIISVALVLVLMLAITRIFSITSTTVGASQGFAAATRDARAAQAVFARDFGALASDSPFVVIRSTVDAAFRSPLDAQSDKDYDAGVDASAEQGAIRSYDVDGSGTETTGGPLVGPFVLNLRNHRQDILTFFGRDRFYRQTGNDGTLVANTSSPEAWIWYGHLVLPGSDGAYVLSGSAAPTTPGAGRATTNANNFYANQWVLGRQAVLLSSSPALQYFNRPGGSAGVPKAPNMTPDFSPFDMSSSPMSTKSADGKYPLVSGRYDIANVTLDDAKNIVSQYSGASWWNLVTVQRFQANPFVLKPITSAGVSQQASIFTPACTGFVVEFAGDFVTQNDTGVVTSATGDGDIDFVFDTTTGSRQIRWYGLPRDTDGDGMIRAVDGDVVPLAAIAGVQPFEKALPYTGVPNPAGDYADPLTTGKKDKYGNTVPVLGATVNASPEYLVAWGTESIGDKKLRPLMYRITLTIDRPEMASRTAGGQSFEYVFNAP